MDLKGKRVILGSNSPRRRELLAGLNIDFEVDTGNDFDERFSSDTPYDEVPRLMSVGKEQFPEPIEPGVLPGDGKTQIDHVLFTDSSHIIPPCIDLCGPLVVF